MHSLISKKPVDILHKFLHVKNITYGVIDARRDLTKTELELYDDNMQLTIFPHLTAIITLLISKNCSDESIGTFKYKINQSLSLQSCWNPHHVLFACGRPPGGHGLSDSVRVNNALRAAAETK